MNELTNEKYMSVSEVATALSVHKNTVLKYIEKLAHDRVPVKNKQGGYRLTEEDVTRIKLSLQQNPFVDTLSMPKTKMEEAAILKQANEIINRNYQEAIRSVAELHESNTELQIQLDIEKSWYSVKRVLNMGYLPGNEARSLERPLRNWSIDNDIQVRGIFDANFGEVKTYHRDAWEAVHGIRLFND